MKTIVAGAALAALAGCATTPVPPERIHASEQAIQQAVAANAEREPGSAKYLDLAKKELGQAKQLSASGERPQAETMLDRVDADAKLAAATAHESAQKAEVKRAEEALKSLGHN